MNAVNVQLIDATVSEKPTSKGGLMNVLTVVYKNLDNDKMESKVLYEPFADKGVWSALNSATKDTIFTVDREKDKKEGKYWDWVGIHRQDSVPAKTGTPVTTRPSYETPEDRAQRQVSIVRQSSLKAAVDLVREHTQDPQIAIGVAKQFEAYVNGTTLDQMTDDIPY